LVKNTCPAYPLGRSLKNAALGQKMPFVDGHYLNLSGAA
jgi:hypothetical protein